MKKLFFLFLFFLPLTSFGAVGYDVFDDVIIGSGSSRYYIGNYPAQYDYTIVPAHKVKVTAVDFYVASDSPFGSATFILQNTSKADCYFIATSTTGDLNVPLLVTAYLTNGNDPTDPLDMTCNIDIGDVFYGQVNSGNTSYTVSTRGDLVTASNGYPYYQLYYDVIPEQGLEEIIIESPEDNYTFPTTDIEIKTLSNLDGVYNLYLYIRPFTVNNEEAYSLVATTSVVAVGVYDWQIMLSLATSTTWEYKARLENDYTGISSETSVRIFHVISPSEQWIIANTTSYIPYAECGITSGTLIFGCMKNVMLWTFVPTPSQLYTLGDHFSTFFLETFPFSLLTRVFVHMDSSNVETFPSFTYTFGSYAPGGLEGKSYTFDPFSATNMSKILEIESDTSEKNIWEITEVWWETICLLGLLTIILSDIFGVIFGDPDISNVASQDRDKRQQDSLRRLQRNSPKERERLRGSFKRI